MLAELQEIASSLRYAGIAPPKPHPWVKPQEKGDFLVVCLDADGHVAEVELRAWDEPGRLFKIQKDNQNSFPAYKIAAPLWAISPGDPVRQELKRHDITASECGAILESLCAGNSVISAAGKKKFKARLQEFARELQPVFSKYAEEAPAVCLLMQQLLREDFDVDRFICDLKRAVISQIRDGRDTPKGLGRALLIGTVNPKTSALNEQKITFVLDIDSGTRWNGDFDRVANPGMQAIYHRVLSAEPEQGDGQGRCALTGTDQPIETGVFPTLKFPVIDNTLLFSMNPDTGCHDRYGLIGSDIYPVGKRTTEELYQAAFWITAGERKSKTWRSIPSARGDKNDLLIAYIEGSADTSLDLASVFSEGDSSDREAVFESVAAQVVQALDARGTMPREWKCRLLVLHRISKGQVQVQISRRYSVDQIKNALREWQQATHNTPAISTRLPGKSPGESELYSVRSLFPGEMLRATKSVWIRGGTESQSIAGCGLARIYDLFLEQGPVLDAAAGELLRIILERAGELLARFGAGSDVSPNGRKAAVDASTILAVCLYKLGERKEKYMEESAFLLGRILSLADVLHLQYCLVKRDEDVPPQLLGNQHLAMAALNPVGALSLLCDRIRIYKAWADTDRRGDTQADTAHGEGGENSVKPAIAKAIKLARWALGQVGNMTGMLSGNLPERALTDREKAEMLLGYLAREKKSQTDQGDTKQEIA